MVEKITKIGLNPAKLFDIYLNGHGISSTWVANSLEVSISLISKIRSGKIPLTENMRQKMNELLETDY